MEISQTPFTPSGFTCGSCSSTKITSMTGGASAWTGTAYSAKLAFGTRPLRASTTECSMSAMPMPPIMPPMHLTARCLRVDDAAGPVGADDAPHARFPEIRVYGDFHEHGSERMHGPSLRRGA